MKKLTVFLRNFFLLAFAFLIVINIHEIGHTLVAKYLGDTHAYYKLIEFNNGHLTAIGKNVYALYIFNDLQIIFISLAGVLASQVFAIFLIFIATKIKKIKDTIFAKYLIFASGFDLAFQELQGIFAPLQHRNLMCPRGVCGNDFADVFWLIAQKLNLNSTIGILAIKLISLLITIVWLYVLYKLASRIFTNRK